MNNLIKKNNNGFTLIELLAVVVILGVLISIAVPKVFSSIDRAEDEAAKAELRALKAAVEIFYLEHRNELPDQIDWNENFFGIYIDISNKNEADKVIKKVHELGKIQINSFSEASNKVSWQDMIMALTLSDTEL